MSAGVGKPCEFPAGSLERLQTYRKRAEAGQPLFNSADAKKLLTPHADADAKRALIEADRVVRRDCA
jgi:hypothetical protein